MALGCVTSVTAATGWHILGSSNGNRTRDLQAIRGRICCNRISRSSLLSHPICVSSRAARVRGTASPTPSDPFALLRRGCEIPRTCDPVLSSLPNLQMQVPTVRNPARLKFFRLWSMCPPRRHYDQHACTRRTVSSNVHRAPAVLARKPSSRNKEIRRRSYLPGCSHLFRRHQEWACSPAQSRLTTVATGRGLRKCRLQSHSCLRCQPLGSLSGRGRVGPLRISLQTGR